MAHIRCDFRSDILDMNTSMTVVLPEDVPVSTAPVVYLFHGLADNCTGWARYTSVERYAREYSAALVIPEVQRSFYSSMEYGLDYFSFIHDELPEICGRFFGLSHDRDRNYVMGLSMGGYGALKCALNTPERYAGCAAFSAAADIVSRVESSTDQVRREYTAVFGQELSVPDSCNLFTLAGKVNPAVLPKFYLACGEQDELYAQNERFASTLQGLGADAVFEHWTGIHNWEFWDAAVCKALKHMLGNLK